MKQELERKIKSVCQKAGSSAAAAKYSELAEKLGKEYDQRVAAGMSELDAYRDVLKNIDEIEAILRAMPKTEEDFARDQAKARGKKMSKLLGTASSVLWLAAVLLFFVLNRTFRVGISLLVFPWAAMGQTFLDMTGKILKGKPTRKVLREGLSGILWLGAVIVFFLFRWYFFWDGWLVFVAAAIVQVILSAVLGNEKK